MKRYEYAPRERAMIEQSRIPCAVFQDVDGKAAALALSAGFLELFGPGGPDVCNGTERDMCRGIHPEDAQRIAEAARRLVREGEAYNVVYRAQSRGGWHVIHARGGPVSPEPGVRLAVVWYMDEGVWQPRDRDPDYMLLRSTRGALRGGGAGCGRETLETLEEMRAEKKILRRIMALSGDYIVIYVVDPVTGSYVEYNASDDPSRPEEFVLSAGVGNLKMTRSGSDFYTDAEAEGAYSIHPEDRDRVFSQMRKENLLRRLEETGSVSINYRLLLNGKINYVCLRAVTVQEPEGRQMIVGIHNINEQILREQSYLENLSAARDMASHDILTGLRNKRAYTETEAGLNGMIRQKEELRFAAVVMDLNGLKHMNDTLGHRAGDELLKGAAGVISRIFTASPAFRIGGDEFVVLCQGFDYDNLDGRIAELDSLNREHLARGGPVIARGVSRYDGDPSVAAVFERADARMYENKKALKDESRSALRQETQG